MSLPRTKRGHTGLCRDHRHEASKTCQPPMRVGKTERDHSTGAWTQRLQNRHTKAQANRGGR